LIILALHHSALQADQPGAPCVWSPLGRLSPLASGRKADVGAGASGSAGPHRAFGPPHQPALPRPGRGGGESGRAPPQGRAASGPAGEVSANADGEGQPPRAAKPALAPTTTGGQQADLPNVREGWEADVSLVSCQRPYGKRATKALISSTIPDRSSLLVTG
jgi:hypothetical protein